MQTSLIYDCTPRFVHLRVLSASRYTGKERDTESGLDYFGARYYASNMGRFMSPDWASNPQAVPYATYANPQSLNLYNYMHNNPLGGTDPTGHWPDWDSKLGQIITGVGKAVYNATAAPVSFVWKSAVGAPTSGSFLGASNSDQAVGMQAGSRAIGMAAAVLPGFGGSTTVTAEAPAALSTESTTLSTTTLFRAVDSTEMTDLQSTGTWNASPNGADGKGFFYSQDSATQFGAQQSAMGGPSTTVVTSTAPTDMVNSSYQQSAATEGKAVFVQNQNLPQVKPQVPPQQ